MVSEAVDRMRRCRSNKERTETLNVLLRRVDPRAPHGGDLSWNVSLIVALRVQNIWPNYGGFK